MAKSDGAKSQGSQGSTGPSEEMKRKFREALDKKQSHAGRDVSDDSEHGKVDHAQGAATSATQQMFRRKSGG
ncbi:DUF5302 domain-containing protein [Phycicoccus sp. Root563]|uniref:DUF5302 domain-containing protein n=1 Tax=Phycicoccus sp. Root563 TaxID=1736562 RepID=UPI000703A127|nr:hypothetical protein ASD62_04410 [Phycicoccus sp. Root563]